MPIDAAMPSAARCSAKRRLVSGRVQPVLQRPVEPAVYTSKAYARLCADLGVTQPMGAVGPSADNALAELSPAWWMLLLVSSGLR